VVAKVRHRLSVSKRGMQHSDMERFSPKKLNNVEVKEHYHVEVLNRLNLDGHVDGLGKISEKI